MPLADLPIKDREYQKFAETDAGEVAVRTLVANDATSPIPVSGTSSVAGATGPVRRGVFTVTDTAQNPIPTPLANRVSLIIRNSSATNNVYFGEDNTITADASATGGWLIGTNEDFSIDLNASNTFYLICDTGQTADVRFLEIASSAGGGGGLSGTMFQEQLTGSVNGVNTNFTITLTPIGAAYFQLFVDGLYQELGVDFTRSGLNIVMNTAPLHGQKLHAVYWY